MLLYMSLYVHGQEFFRVHAEMRTIWVTSVHIIRFSGWCQIAHPISGTILLSPEYCFSTPTHSIIKLILFVNMMSNKCYLIALFLHFPDSKFIWLSLHPFIGHWYSLFS